MMNVFIILLLLAFSQIHHARFLWITNLTQNATPNAPTPKAEMPMTEGVLVFKNDNIQKATAIIEINKATDLFEDDSQNYI